MFLKQSTGYTFRFGPFVDDSDGKTAETGLTIEDEHIRVSKNGGNFIDKAETSDSSHDEAGFYIVVLNTSDTNTVGELQIACHMSGALPVFKTFQVVEEAIYDALFAASATGELLVDVAKISGDSTAADNMELMFDGTGYAGGTTKLSVNTTQIEGSDATDQINAACDASIVTYNLDHLMAAAVASNADMTAEVVDGSVLSNILTKTGDTSDYAYATDSLEALGEMWTTALTESYADKDIAPTPAQFLFMIWSCMSDFNITDTTIASRKIDGSTATEMEWTIDNATTPTSRTRSD